MNLTLLHHMQNVFYYLTWTSFLLNQKLSQHVRSWYITIDETESTVNQR